MDKAYLWNKLSVEIRTSLQDDDITEIIVNPDGKVWHVYNGKGAFTHGYFCHDSALDFIQSVAQINNLYINENKPYLDCVLPFKGERLNATMQPITEGASFNIRKKSNTLLKLSDYIKAGSLTSQQYEFLVDAIKKRKNILVSGGPGAGKTTFTNALLERMAVVANQGTRVLLLEQVAELECEVANCKRLLTAENIDLRTLLWITMRNSPDRIIIGEVRDGAALDMLKAWNTGCPGGIATIHANSPKAALQRVIDLSLEVTATAPYHLVAEALDIIVQIDNAANGRRVSGIAQVRGYDPQRQSFQLDTME